MIRALVKIYDDETGEVLDTATIEPEIRREVEDDILERCVTDRITYMFKVFYKKVEVHEYDEFVAKMKLR